MNLKLFKKAGAAVMAAAMMFNGVIVGSASVSAADSKVEFETADFTGDVTVESGSGASGGSYLKMTDSGTISLKFNVAEGGLYKLTIYAGGIGSDKQQNLSVNGAPQGALAIPESDGFEAIVIPAVKLKAGENTLTIEKSWGWSNFDYMSLESASLPSINATQTSPVDPEAIPEAKSLMNYLSSVYGKNIISGQQEIYQYGPHGMEYEFEYLEKLTGHMPAIRGFDYGNFTCPAFGSDDGSTERVIDWVKNRNGIATSSWHLNVPTDFASYTTGSKIAWEKTTYTQNTDFSPAKAATPGTKENAYYLAALTTLAEEFNELEEQGIPVLWRPLHEAEGGGGETGSWFWWGREGSEAYKKLWVYTYETLTNDFDCHNLIWEWNSYDFPTSENWYPGDQYVDIIGYDKYNCTDWSTGSPVLKHNDSAISSTFYSIMERYDNAKMVAMTENDSFSTVENLTSEKAGWLYFCTWYDGGSADNNFLTNPVFNTEQDTIDMYKSDYCITLDELPADLYKNGNTSNPGTTAPVKTTTTTTTTAPITTTTTTTTPSQSGSKGFYVDGQTIRDANGNAFEMRGVNIAHCWYKDKTEQSIKAAAELGTNCVRIVCSNGVQWSKTTASELEQIIEWCKENKQICIFEVHDATGSNNISDIVKAAEYWAEMKDILNANTKYVILNIANEWYGDWQSATWADGCKQAIDVVRDAGIKNMIIMDSAGWGQYPTSIKEKGAEVFASDPEKNIVSSIHMYEYAGGTADMVKSNIDGALQCGAPVIVGEFGLKHTDGDVDEATVMNYCKQNKMGYIAWSWMGNSGGVEYLDLVSSWDGSKLTEWGEIYFNAIKNNSSIATVYTADQPSANVKYGDANCDGEVNMADAVMIMQSIANPNKYVLTAEGSKNADCSGGNDGVTNKDALAIQRFKLGLLVSLPEA